MNGKIINGTHFCIKHVTAFTPLGKDAETVDFGRSHALLYLNYAAAQGVLFQRSGLNQMKMDPKALEHYLLTSVHYLGKKQCRFVVLLPNGQQDMITQIVDGVSKSVINEMRPNALVFDYEALKASTDIELETMKSSILPGPDVDEPKPAPPPPTLFPSNDHEEDLPF